MTPVEILGWAGALAAISIGIPQAVRLLRTRSTAGLAVLTWQLLLGLNIGWFGHGILIEAPNMVVPNVFSAVVSATVLLLIRSARGLNPVTILIPTALIAAVMIGADLIGGSTAFGVVALLGSLIANAGQAINLVRSPDVSGVAPGYLIAQLVNQVLWVTWGFAVSDSGTILSSISTGLVIVFSTIWWLLRRAGLRPLFVRAESVGVVSGQAAPVSSRP